MSKDINSLSKFKNSRFPSSSLDIKLGLKKIVPWSIDSKTITDYNASTSKLEALLIFWILAAGKTAKGAERILSSLLNNNKISPFSRIKEFDQVSLSIELKSLGCGCFNIKGRSIIEIANSGLNLKECSVDDLEKIYGIGRKTSRGFILHSRKNAQCAVLDTHILKFLITEKVKNVPKSTPNSKKEYSRLEQEFLQICKLRNKVPAEYDLEIWKSYALK